jgi:hypothetical protein
MVAFVRNQYRIIKVSFLPVDLHGAGVILVFHCSASGSSSSVPVHWICSHGDIIVFRVHVWFRGSPRYAAALLLSRSIPLLLLLMLLLLVYLLSLSRCISVDQRRLSAILRSILALPGEYCWLVWRVVHRMRRMRMLLRWFWF